MSDLEVATDDVDTSQLEVHDNRAAALAALAKHRDGAAPSEDGDAEIVDDQVPEEAAEKKPKTPEDRSYRHIQRKLARIRTERETLQKDRDAFQRERAELERHRGAADKLAKLAALREDDIEAFLEEAGIPYDELTKRLLEKGTPDEKTSKLERELRQLKRDAEAREKAEQEREANAKRAAAREASRASVVKAAQDSSAYPILSELQPRDILKDCDEMADAMAEDGDGLRDDEEIEDFHARVLANVEKLNAAREARAVKRYLARNGGTVKEAKEAVAEEREEKRPRARTLSARDTKDAGAKKKDDDDWSDEARRNRALAALRKHRLPRYFSEPEAPSVRGL